MKKQPDNKKGDNKNRKAILGFAGLFVAIAIIAGGMYAYFSDVITGSGSATAGTLDITGDYEFYQYVDTNGDGVQDAGELTLISTVDGGGNPTVNNLNPGDIIVVQAAVENEGNKSAWLRNVIDFGSIDAGIAPFIKVYEGTQTLASISAATGLVEIPTSGGVSTSAPVIINGGSGTNDETEAQASTPATTITNYTASLVPFLTAAFESQYGTSSTYGTLPTGQYSGQSTYAAAVAAYIAANTSTALAAIYLGSSTVNVSYTIYFDVAATNDAQGKSLAFSAKTQALQYRNNSTNFPTATQWGTVVTTPFSL
jgi:hypothetical protein